MPLNKTLKVPGNTFDRNKTTVDNEPEARIRRLNSSRPVKIVQLKQFLKLVKILKNKRK